MCPHGSTLAARSLPLPSLPLPPPCSSSLVETFATDGRLRSRCSSATGTLTLTDTAALAVALKLSAADALVRRVYQRAAKESGGSVTVKSLLAVLSGSALRLQQPAPPRRLVHEVVRAGWDETVIRIIPIIPPIIPLAFQPCPA